MKKKQVYSKFEPGWEGEPDFGGELGAEDLGGAIEKTKLERCVVADFDSEFALSLQFHLPYSTSHGTRPVCFRVLFSGSA